MTNLRLSEYQEAARVRSLKGFTLLELLAVMTIIVTMMAISGPAIRALGGAGTINKAASDFSSTLEVARSYAMANSTFVRVVMAEITLSGVNKLVLMSLYAADGSLDQDGAADMADSSIWPQLSKALVLDHMYLDTKLEAPAPDTRSDDVPWEASSDIADFDRMVPGVHSTALSFQSCIQFSPSGEARISTTIPSRHIKIPIDQAGERAGDNPIILRVSGATGRVHVVRLERGS